MSSFFTELKRRNVFRVGIAYIIAAWLVMQFADVILNNVDAPGWVFQVILLLLGIGLLFAIFFAWAFELTPEGLKKEKDVDRSQSITPQTGRKLDFMIIGVLVVALGYFVADKFVFQPSAQTETDAVASSGQSSDQPITHSIAVLPFVDMSAAKDHEYFTDGLTEELLNILAKIKSLQVAGRTSSFAFKGRNEDLRTIGEKLNVKTLLEGSVRKDDKRQKIRVTVQLINVEDGYHIWSESYDRSLDDIFAIQEEIALEVAAALKINLLGEDEAKITGLARANQNAYDFYLQGRKGLAENSFSSLQQALDAFAQAVALDPVYVPAQLGWAETYLRMGDIGSMGLQEALAQGEALLTKIIERDPLNGSALALMAEVFINRQQPDYKKGEEYLRAALGQNPRNVAALSSYSNLLRAIGDADALSYAQQAAVLEPYSAEVQYRLCSHYNFQQHFEQALDVCKKVREIEPANPSGYYGAGQVHNAQGNLDQYIYWFAQAMPLDPDDPEIPASIAEAWLDLDDLQQTRLWLDKAIAIDAEQPATIGARIRMLQAMEQTVEARTLARNALTAGMEDRQGSNETILYALVDEALKAGDVERALTVLRNVYAEAFHATSPDELRGRDMWGLARAGLLLIQNPASAEAETILSAVEQNIEDMDFEGAPNYIRGLKARAAMFRGDQDKAVKLLLESYDNGGLRDDWRARLVESFWYTDLHSHPGFKQLIAMLEAESVTQRENAYKLLASLE